MRVPCASAAQELEAPSQSVLASKEAVQEDVLIADNFQYLRRALQGGDKYDQPLVVRELLMDQPDHPLVDSCDAHSGGRVADIHGQMTEVRRWYTSVGDSDERAQCQGRGGHGCEHAGVQSGGPAARLRFGPPSADSPDYHHRLVW
eukprot:4471890-Pyramimonas_sp.AAC.1